MDTRQTNRITMFRTVIKYLDQHAAVWAAMAPLAAAVQLLKDTLALIDATMQKQAVPTKGAAVNKSTARDALEDVLFLICEALGALGHTSGDNDLVALTALSVSILHKLGEEELSARAALVLAAANTHKPALVTINVTQANIDELTQALQSYNASKETPRTATAERAAQTDLLPGLLRDGSDVLRNRIDRMVNLFQRTNPEFLAGYRSARVVFDRRGGHAAAKAPGTPPPTTP